MYCREIKTKHGQTRWAVDIVIRGVKREVLFAHEAAAEDALVIAGMDRDWGVPPEQTLRRLRMLAWDTLNFEHELSDAEFETLKEIDELRERKRSWQEEVLRLCLRAGLQWRQAQNLTIRELLDFRPPPPESHGTQL
jgi:hypothetical protein